MGSDGGRCRVALLSSTQFGQRCLEDGILPCPDTELVGIVTTNTSIKVGKQKKNDNIEIVSPSDFRAISKQTGCELVILKKKPHADDYVDAFNRWKPDILLVLGWYYLLPQSVLNYAPLGTVAIHASLLPRYRGMAPIPWAIINGEHKTGVTLFYLDNTMDGGDIIAQSPVIIGDADDCAIVYTNATEKSIELLSQYLPLLANKSAPRIKQNNSHATQFPRRRPEDGLIDWSQSATRIYDFIRAQTRPYPGAFTWLQGRKITIWQGMAVEPVGEKPLPGQIIRRNGFTEIVTANGSIRLLDFKIEGASSVEQEKCWLIPGSICCMSPNKDNAGNEKQILSYG